LPIGQLRWGPTPLPSEKLTFVAGLRTMTTAGDCETMAGMAAHVALITAPMVREHFYNADGEMLIVAQQGRLRLRTEFGVIEIEPGEVCVIPRGVIFRVEPLDGAARGLCVRELRRRFHAAGSRADRRELSGQPARFSHAGRFL
jgi:homogentisate 1,2-dioxygenase